MFGREYKLIHQDFGHILGFQTGPTTAPDVPISLDTQDTLETFRKNTTNRDNIDPSTQFSRYIDNPIIRYFQMILAQTSFGRSDTCEPLSEEELFILHCITESDSVESGTFLITNLRHIYVDSEGLIHVGVLLPKLLLLLNSKTSLAI